MVQNNVGYANSARVYAMLAWTLGDSAIRAENVMAKAREISIPGHGNQDLQKKGDS